jgi:biotin carboxyl carrier protein
MKVKYNTSIYNIETKLENNKLVSIINGELIEFEAPIASDNKLQIFHNQQKQDIYYSSDDKFVYVFLNGKNFKFEKVNEDEESSYEIDQKDLNREEIKPPMPGNIIKILATIGQEVDETTPILIIEAMKMETTLYSSITGKVTAINVKERDQVDSDQVLIVIEK